MKPPAIQLRGGMILPASDSDNTGSGSAGFDRLAEPVRRWIWGRRWPALRDIQERAIPQILDHDKDLIIAAATAGGKTEAAFLPLISQVLAAPGAGGFDLVYIGPLKALINDQLKRLGDICAGCNIPVHPWHGDISAGVKARARRNPGGILLITPESLEALFVLRGREIAALFAGTRAVVIDELHALLDSERGVHLRSLLARVERARGRCLRRIGLSATLGDMALARGYLRPDAPESVILLESTGEGQALQVQLRGYTKGGNADAGGGAAQTAIAKHLFDKLRGTQNLVFAGSRQSVEIYADRLRRLCEERALPNEFFAHHASLARDHRSFVEDRLKDAALPTTAICTSTLELGIDIGNVACVGQIGAPFSVAALRQRLGRSGRRDGAASVLRLYVTESALDAISHPVDRLRLGLVRAIAMVDLLIERQCEPPATEALHLSTLVHQILSVIAQKGGALAKEVYETLCVAGPFRRVDAPLFARVLRQIGSAHVALIEQAPDGVLLLGARGEKIVEHHSFYAVFQTPEEYRLEASGKLLGTLPVTNILAPGMTIIFSGRRWRVETVRDVEKVIGVVADETGRPPTFGGDTGAIHDMVVARMREVFAAKTVARYLDPGAAALLAEARAAWAGLGLERSRIVPLGDRHWLLATWAGTVRTTTLSLALRARYYDVTIHDGFLDVKSRSDMDIRADLAAFARAGEVSGDDVVGDEATLTAEKFHLWLGRSLVLQDALASRLDLASLPELAEGLLKEGLG